MVKHSIQLAKNECGIACLKMFYDYFEVECSYSELLDKVKITDKGVSIDEMIYHLNSLAAFNAYEIDSEELKNLCPSIVLLSKKDKSHYVVVWKYENGYFYVSDPNTEEIKKIKESGLLKDFSKYIIFNQKREVNISFKNIIKIKYGLFKIPYIIFSILEVFLVTYSMLYLFSIKDFTVVKIGSFLTILFINCLISLMKNLCLNSIQKNIDEEAIDKKLKDDFIKGKINNINLLKIKIQEGYQIKNELIKGLCLIIPHVLILIGSLIYVFFIDKLLFIFLFVIYLLFFMINVFFSIRKNRSFHIANEIEMHLLKYENKILTKSIKEEILKEIDKIKLYTSKYLNISQTFRLVNFALKQFFLISLLIFMYMFKMDLYSIFVVTFYFYSVDGLIEISDYLINRKDMKILIKSFLSE